MQDKLPVLSFIGNSDWFRGTFVRTVKRLKRYNIIIDVDSIPEYLSRECSYTAANKSHLVLVDVGRLGSGIAHRNIEHLLSIDTSQVSKYFLIIDPLSTVVVTKTRNGYWTCFPKHIPSIDLFILVSYYDTLGLNILTIEEVEPAIQGLSSAQEIWDRLAPREQSLAKELCSYGSWEDICASLELEPEFYLLFKSKLYQDFALHSRRQLRSLLVIYPLVECPVSRDFLCSDLPEPEDIEPPASSHSLIDTDQTIEEFCRELALNADVGNFPGPVTNIVNKDKNQIPNLFEALRSRLSAYSLMLTLPHFKKNERLATTFLYSYTRRLLADAGSGPGLVLGLERNAN